ncbi:aspartyl/asparaginyl beta-hydroxylase-like isoform X3 [Portunus trituberculatus]|uniref:aspartyl/asparaginyl beta-hydroxylase-like isoform X3 n=1 Tax=Portunus trituberculatus TaxID=210409 RepID=UPI001E1D1908|nr:aspartyl/asparaginyl beta-hydroxylase-like isoform X3 [Portunus trituberculatus]
MSGDIQPRKRKGKGKRKDDFEDEVIESKTHHNNNKNHNAKVVSNGDAGIGGSGSSGFVAKAIFLLLLVSLSLVVALILVELRGKEKAAMEDNALKSEVGEEMVPPPPPPPPPAMEEESPSAEASIAQEAEEEEPEPLSATPPLEEYVKVVREVVMEPLPGEALPQPEAEDKREDDPVVEEVVEVVEVVTPVEEIVEILPTTEEVVEPPSDTSPAEEPDEVQTPPTEDVKTEEPEVEDKGDDIVKEKTPEDPEIEDKDDDVKEETPEEPISVEVVEPVEATPSAEEEEEEKEEEKLPAEVTDDKEPAEEKQPVVDEEKEEEVEEEEEEEEEEEVKEEEEEEDEEEEEEEVESPSAPVEEKVVPEEMPIDKENEEEEEDWSQFGKEGSTGALTDAYLKVEVLAEDILALDPQNAMVAQVAPHMAGVWRAMKEGQTEGLLETLNHIQVILEDVKKRVEEKEPIVIPGPPSQDAPEPEEQPEPVSESAPEPESVVKAEVELSSEPETVVEPQSEPILQEDPETQTSVEPDQHKEQEPEVVSEEAVTEGDSGSEIQEAVETEKEVEVEVVKTEKEIKVDTIETEKEAIVVDKITQTDVVQTEMKTEVKAVGTDKGEEIVADLETQTEEPTQTEAEPELGTETERDSEAGVEKEMELETEVQDEKETEDIETHNIGNENVEVEIVEEKDIAENHSDTVIETNNEAETQTSETETDFESKPALQEQSVPVPVPAEEEHKAPEAAGSISEAEIADIEAQIIPDGTPEDPLQPGPPPAEDEEPVTPQVAEGGSDTEPVDEVIPDPIHIEPLQEPAKEPQVEAVEEKQPLDTEEKVADTGANGDSIIDSTIREDLEQADELLPENPGKALNAFGALLHHNPKSARAIYGRARSLDQLAETEKSNSKLEQAIVTYRSLMDLADEEPALVPLPLLQAAAERCIDRMKFRGFFGKALRVQQRLLRRFPDDITLRNNMGVTYLLMNQGSAAKEVFEAVLQQWPDNGFAQVHYGFVLKTTYNNITGGAYYMQKGIASMADGTQDERFFFHLGDALQRQGKVEEAYKIYDEAVEKGMFLNRYQRSLYNVDRLTSQPLWTLEQTTYQVFFRKLEENWEVIRNEGVALLGLPVQDGFRPEAENLRDIGDWKQYELFTKGRKITANCVKAPRTCSLIEQFPAAAGCKRGQVKFSVMQPNTHVHAHTGPTNCRLRAHLGLVVPKGVFLKVAEETVTWEEGKIFIFDDSWEHEVWHEGDSLRLVLIVDVWHPELTEHERKTLSPI